MLKEHSTDYLGRLTFLMSIKRMEEINNAVFPIWRIPTVLSTQLGNLQCTEEKHKGKTEY